MSEKFEHQEYGDEIDQNAKDYHPEEIKWQSAFSGSDGSAYLLGRVLTFIDENELYKNNPDKTNEFLNILLAESKKVAQTITEIRSILEELDSLIPDIENEQDVNLPIEPSESLKFLLNKVSEKYSKHFYEKDKNDEFIGLGYLKSSLQSLIRDTYGPTIDKENPSILDRADLGLFISPAKNSFYGPKLSRLARDGSEVSNIQSWWGIRDIARNGDYFDAMDFMYKKGGADIFYFAPRSATFPAKSIKYFIDFIADRNPNIKKPYFSFPTSKTFKRIDADYYSNSILNYLKDPTSNNRDILLKHIGNISGKENFIDTIDNLKKIFELKSKESENISIVLFDESMNHGYTVEYLEKLVKVVASYFEKEKGVKISIDRAPIVYDDGYSPHTTPIKGLRDDYSTKFSRYSGTEDPIRYDVIKLADKTTKLLGEMVGLHYFAKDKLKEIFDKVSSSEIV
jgi:hypothetical protein